MVKVCAKTAIFLTGDGEPFTVDIPIDEVLNLIEKHSTREIIVSKFVNFGTTEKPLYLDPQFIRGISHNGTSKENTLIYIAGLDDCFVVPKPLDEVIKIIEKQQLSPKVNYVDNGTLPPHKAEKYRNPLAKRGLKLNPFSLFTKSDLSNNL